MTFGPRDHAEALFAVVTLLVAAHGGGALFARVRQPRVIGEIAGGVLLGPTVLGALAPALQHRIFDENLLVQAVLAASAQFGLYLLMFTSGLELRPRLAPAERRTVVGLVAAGTLLPVGAGAAFLALWDPAQLVGPAGHGTALALVVAIAVAVTSIPVISRIFLDLGLLQTRFARIVLGAAIVEDLLLYVVLAVALALVSHGDAVAFVPAWLGLGAGGALARFSTAYHVAISVAFFGVALAVGPRVHHAITTSRLDLVRRSNTLASQLTTMMTLTVLAAFLGVAPMFGAFLAGIVVRASGARSPDPDRAAEEKRAEDAGRGFSLAFFVPLYFGAVGLRLDLLHDLAPGLLAAFLGYACLAKAASVYLGGRLAGEPHGAAVDLAVAMNARGGPGIVLAQVAGDAGIVSPAMRTTLVLVALVTSILAGAWLERRRIG